MVNIMVESLDWWEFQTSDCDKLKMPTVNVQCPFPAIGAEMYLLVSMTLRRTRFSSQVWLALVSKTIRERTWCIVVEGGTQLTRQDTSIHQDQEIIISVIKFVKRNYSSKKVLIV